MNAMRQAHADGWFIVFDTLTLADDRLEAFYDNPNALRDYFRDIGRMVLAAEGRKANDTHADCYQYFCVPEYGIFFSSRSRHTILQGGWSSDVCSSDLQVDVGVALAVRDRLFRRAAEVDRSGHRAVHGVDHRHVRSGVAEHIDPLAGGIAQDAVRKKDRKRVG